jgi:hypothetical protein
VQVSSRGYSWDGGTGWIPELDFLGYPVSEARAYVADPSIAVLTSAEDQALGGFLGVTWDQSKAWLSIYVTDCTNGITAGATGVPAAGVQLSIDVPDPDHQVARYYGLMNPSLTATATDSSGVAGFVNIPAPGIVNVTAKPLALGGKVSSQAHVYVRPGTLTSLFLYPTP